MARIQLNYANTAGIIHTIIKETKNFYYVLDGFDNACITKIGKKSYRTWHIYPTYRYEGVMVKNGYKFLEN
jgi:hypothetical protein